MYFLRKMQEDLSHGCGDDGQFQEEKKRDGLHPMHGMCKGLPKGRIVMESIKVCSKGAL